MALPENPITRKETYLAKIAGQEVQIPDVPITREEAYLDKIAKNGGGSGGTSDYTDLTNKPQINSVELSGNKTASQLGLMASDGVVANPTGQTTGTLTALEVGGTKYAVPSGGTSDYTDLSNKPSINSVELSGNKTTGDLGLQDELTFDNVPTNGSNNPVKSDGVYDSEKDIYAVMGQMGAKNLNSYPYADTTKTTNGITFTDNGDGTVTANGTATADVYFSCHLRTQGESNDLIIPNGSYTLSGCPSGGGSSTYALSAFRTHNGSADLLGRDNGNGTSVVANGDDFSANEVNLQINILVKNGQTVSNLTFKPMLRLASDTDDTYQPYAKTNRELTESYPANKVMMSDGVTSVEDAVDEISENVIKQTAGTSITIQAQYVLYHDGVDYCGFSLFPFVAKNNNYSVQLTDAYQDNVGNVLGSVTIISKYNTGFRVKIPGAYDYKKCVVILTYTITFA